MCHSGAVTGFCTGKPSYFALDFLLPHKKPAPSNTTERTPRETPTPTPTATIS
ncbi:hypothetical protein ASPVEDRAFT_45344 [Aspergillus versicolor CBS 583.65]|uniref:Uncharacterized protein n=1 Tax=Aspergillus versicolor CBS 583.65 TaxID=1036611 RepID=A0A1L9PWK9_ASPVE|nr:uncharacterized protein ASPVEDRAFT_45344 [Aspergillus versicolor CBS 583.65]OJJ05897.1 hypothetical protein ASPVEDRAFT_45344 [Aspergillus versicolor CBS 583.65]